MSAPPVEVRVEADGVVGDLARLWTSIGYDELNWTGTPRGRALLRTLASFEGGPYLVRSHNMFTSGTGMALPHWSAGNVYQEDAAGRVRCDFQLLDAAYDAVVEAGHVPIVELGFTPQPLVPEDAAQRYAYEPGSPSQYGFYEAGGWSFPPKSLARWGELVAATVAHCARRYGRARLAPWRFEVWNEPDISYWRGTPQEYFALYRTSVEAVRSVLPEARVGGPATTGDLQPNDTERLAGPAFLGRFLDECVRAAVPIDFVSFHTKGVYFRPLRGYQPPGALAAPQSPSMVKMLREVKGGLDAVAARPELAGVECLADECDASVPAHHGRFDNSNFSYRNSEYYPVFQCALMKKLLDLDAAHPAHLAAATAWAFYIEGERCFEGTRSLVTYADIEKPVLHAYRLLGRLGRKRLRAHSSAAWPLERLEVDEEIPEEVDVLAARDEGDTVAVLCWRHRDDQHAPDRTARAVRISLSGLGSAVVTVREWRVDAAHGNSFRLWESLGAPDYPDAEQIAALRHASELGCAGPDRRERVVDGVLVLDSALALPAAVLFEITPVHGVSQ